MRSSLFRKLPDRQSNSNRALRRHRRDFIPGQSPTRLEVRALLTPMAVIEWSMAPMIARDPAHGNQPDLPNTRAYVDPPHGYQVTLDASHSVGLQPYTSFYWKVMNSEGREVVTPHGERRTINLLPGSYTVDVRTDEPGPGGRPVSASTKITVKDVLIVSIGDSYASGEGNPIVPGIRNPEWAYSPDPEMNIQNAKAHRSTIAGPAQFALELQQSNPHEAVTFVSVANSGASIPVGLLGPMEGVVDSKYRLPPEIAELKQIIGTRHIDVLTISIGANDIQFSNLAKGLIQNTAFGSPSLESLLMQYQTDLNRLPRQFADLDEAIRQLHPSQVLITGYPNMFLDDFGEVAALPTALGLTLINKTDAQFASDRMYEPLNETLAAAATLYHWTIVNQIYYDFSAHGYPSSHPWFVRLEDSIVTQGDHNGTFHPNAAGHLDIARNLLAAYEELQAKP
jgi:lysophospholipase L1-like esterase